MTGNERNESNREKRFGFGKNWQSFLRTLTPERIRTAEASLQEMLGTTDLTGERVLDIGSGSGLFSLAARNLGAEVVSFDYDNNSVACTQDLRSRYFAADKQWTVEQGSVLDGGYLKRLGQFDLVYSWGVLHHTGQMWTAIANAAERVAEGGTLFIAIYNDEGAMSRFWMRVKRFYCSSPLGKLLVLAAFMPLYFLHTVLRSALSRRNLFAEYRARRGMSIVHDWYDWLGGWPFEVAKVEEILHFLQERGFVLTNIKTTNRLGNNQFVFRKETPGLPQKRAA